MRDFFVNSLEKLIGVIVVFLCIGVVGFAASVSFGSSSGVPTNPWIGLVVLIGGAMYVILVGGFLYMGVGIYQNTKRTADAIEKLAQR
jgi:hypothetical protein